MSCIEEMLDDTQRASDGFPLNPERLAALGKLADSAATGMDEAVQTGEGERDDRCRRVFAKAMSLAEKRMARWQMLDADLMDALATVADAAACGFKDESEDGD